MTGLNSYCCGEACFYVFFACFGRAFLAARHLADARGLSALLHLLRCNVSDVAPLGAGGDHPPHHHHRANRYARQEQQRLRNSGGPLGHGLRMQPAVGRTSPTQKRS